MGDKIVTIANRHTLDPKKLESALRYLGTGMPLVAAFRTAGIRDPRQTSNTLTKDPDFVYSLVELLQQVAIRWKMIGERTKQVIYAALTEPDVTWEVRARFVALSVKFLSDGDRKALADRAEQEDEAERSHEGTATKFLGPGEAKSA